MATTSSQNADASRATAQAVGAFYIRISKEGYRSEAEVEAQVRRYIEKCEREAQRLGLPAPDKAHVVVETDVSGGKAVDDRLLGALVAEVESGARGWIIAPDVDRFARNIEQGLSAWRRVVEEAGARLVFCDDGIDSREGHNAKERFVFRLVNGEGYLVRTKSRFDDVAREAVERGIHSGSVPPLGFVWPGVSIDRGPGRKPQFKKTGPLEPTEALAGVSAAFALVGSEKPQAWAWHDIMRLTGCKSQGAVANLLRNRVYLGEARSGSYVKPNAHPAAVDEETFERVQRRLAAKTEEHGGKPRARVRTPRALAKVLRCSDCGGVLSPDTARWRCKRIGCASYGAGVAEAVVLPYVLTQAVEAHRFLHLGFEVDAATVTVFEEAVRDARRKAVEAAAALGLDVSDLPAHSKPMQALADARAALRAHEASFGWVGQSEEVVQEMLSEGDPERVNGFVRETLRVFVSKCGRHASKEARTAEARCRVVVLDGSASPGVTWPVDAEPGSVVFPGPCDTGSVAEVIPFPAERS